MNIQFKGDISELIDGLRILSEDYGYCIGDGGLTVTVKQNSQPIVSVIRTLNNAEITYNSKAEFFRALGLLLEHSSTSDTFTLSEEPQFTMNGAMFDVSQGNAVINVKSVKDMLKRMSIMGLNMLMLYTEDSYVVPEQPYFGYMRSKYTFDDYKEIDDYAFSLGVEVIPCIQTLAHLTDALRWEAFDGMKDDGETLLVGNEKVYEFIEQMIKAASAPFRTKRIHIGMDEAWHLGLGHYLDIHGLRPKYEIMNEHLNRVMSIVEKYGLKPMMWSDMFFRANSGGYYDVDSPMKREIIDNFPKQMQMIYWDYYHNEEDFYCRFIEKHREFGNDPIFAGGIWSWTGPAANWGRTFDTMSPALKSCKKEGIKEIFVTIWGDNGTESNVFTNLLGLQYFAEHGYSKEFDEAKFKTRFEFCSGANYDDFIDIKYLDETPGSGEGNLINSNASKYLLWNDILAGLLDYNIKGLPLNEHYSKLNEKFKIAKTRNGHYNFIFNYAQAITDVLKIKSEIGLELTDSYKKGDREAMKIIAEVKLPELLKCFENLREVHMENWFNENKALGWEVLDMRYGSIFIRVRTAIERINGYLSGRFDKLEEIDETRLSFTGGEGMVTYANFYGKIVSASRISPNA